MAIDSYFALPRCILASCCTNFTKSNNSPPNASSRSHPVWLQTGWRTGRVFKTSFARKKRSKTNLRRCNHQSTQQLWLRRPNVPGEVRLLVNTVRHAQKVRVSPGALLVAAVRVPVRFVSGSFSTKSLRWQKTNAAQLGNASSSKSIISPFPLGFEKSLNSLRRRHRGSALLFPAFLFVAHSCCAVEQVLAHFRYTHCKHCPLVPVFVDSDRSLPP
jgi:hypothetical protein